MSLYVDGTFPVAIKVLDGQTELKLKEFKLKTLTVEDALISQTELKDGQYSGIVELCHAIELVAEDGKTHPLTYEALMKTSSQNLRYLEAKKAELDLKEIAES